MSGGGCHLVAVELDDDGAPVSGPLAGDRLVAARDLVAENVFRPAGCSDRPLRLRLAVRGNQLVLDIADAEAAPLVRHVLSLSPLARVIHDYQCICDSYTAARGAMAPRELEAIDMGRRGLHNQGAETLQERLKGKVEMDFATARRLFTLVAALRRR